MTLPEVLISVMLTGMICAALAMSITVVLRQTDNTEGRTNNARSEQSVSLWMPADLASADSVDTLPGALPCTLPCPPEANIGGSNALMLTWTSQVFDTTTGLPVTTTTKVSYRYMQIGSEWVLVRVACETIGAAATTCTSQTVLHGLDAPPGLFSPGVSTPSWIIQVSQALDPASTDPTDTTPIDPTLKNKNGQRVVVTINGGGDASGAGGGTNQISLSAGGTERKQNLDPIDNSGVPPFLAARSRCGGNFALVVDTSGSIGATNMGANISGTPNWSTVRGSIYKFIEAFQGTPVNLEIVSFSAAAQTLGVAGDAQKYYDMLDPAQVSALKSLVGYPNTAGGLQSAGNTNWEDAFYKVFKKASNGAVQPILPKTIIFFTDGVPTWSRVQSAGAAMDPADVPLPAQNSTYYQVGWNRANRLMRQFDADVQSLIGMFVGSSTADSPWVDSLGYHLDNWQKGYHDTYERAYHLQYESGNGVIYQRGSHGTFERSNKVVWERGYHLVYERNSKVVFERSGNNMKYERYTGSSWTTSGASASTYFPANTTTDGSDDWRVTLTGSAGSWTSTSPSMTQATHDASNTTSDSTDGFRVRLNGSLSSTWQPITAAQYAASNSTADSTDGWRVSNVYTAPYDLWESASQVSYNTGNTTTDATDGWRTRLTAATTAWIGITQAEYDDSNTSAYPTPVTDGADGFRYTPIYTTPFTYWETTTQAAYEAIGANTTAANTDGWQTIQPVASTTWTIVTAAQYNLSNTAADSSDGWRIVNSYTAPWDLWESTTQALYNAVVDPAGRRTIPIYTSPYTSWAGTTEALYNANNTSWGPADGWQATKVYVEPYTAYEAGTTIDKLDKDILGRFVQPVGNPVTPLVDGSGNVTNAATANLYTVANYAALNSGMQAIALSECGGTLTIQTRLSSGTSALDPFTYQNSISNTTVTTTSQFKGGTFDFQTTSSVSPTIMPQISDDLDHYSHVGWACTAKGQARSFTTAPVPGQPGWKSINVSVAANEAVSCTQTVQWNP
ncbi:MAG: vWA domain-containing protein [Ilumatobacteraceae bacterium]